MRQITADERKTEIHAQDADQDIQLIHVYNRNLKKRCVHRLAIALLVTLTGYLAVLAVWNPMQYMDHMIFANYDTFVSFMERDDSNPYGEQKTDGEVKTGAIMDAYGNVVYEYKDRNREVFSITCIYKKGEDLPIINVSTWDDLIKAKVRAGMLRRLFELASVIEIIVAVVVYHKKGRSYKNNL